MQNLTVDSMQSMGRGPVLTAGDAEQVLLGRVPLSQPEGHGVPIDPSNGCPLAHAMAQHWNFSEQQAGLTLCWQVRAELPAGRPRQPPCHGHLTVSSPGQA